MIIRNYTGNNRFNRLKMNVFLFFTHPDSSAAVSSLSTSREGEEGESI